MPSKTRISPCLWFNDQAEEAARFYVSLFKDGKIKAISHFGKEGFEQHHRPEGSVMTVDFEIDGTSFTALNGGPHFPFTEAISIMVECDTQEDIDHFWDTLSAGGDPKAQQCGWLKDKYGLSWQIVPRDMAKWMADSPTPESERTLAVMLKMKKLDLEALKRAYEGK